MLSISTIRRAGFALSIALVVGTPLEGRAQPQDPVAQPQDPVAQPQDPVAQPQDPVAQPKAPVAAQLPPVATSSELASAVVPAGTKLHLPSPRLSATGERDVGPARGWLSLGAELTYVYAVYGMADDREISDSDYLRPCAIARVGPISLCTGARLMSSETKFVWQLEVMAFEMSGWEVGMGVGTSEVLTMRLSIPLFRGVRLRAQSGLAQVPAHSDTEEDLKVIALFAGGGLDVSVW